MIAWSGRKKAFMILAFIGPTLLGIIVFNIYPITYNSIISLTNRNQFHPNPDCNLKVINLIEPSCWPMFQESSGVSKPYTWQNPLIKNYSTLLGQLLTKVGSLALVQFVICFIPLIVASQVNKYYDRQLTRPISGILVWLLALLVTVIAFWFIGNKAIKTLQANSDFFIVVFRTILFVILTVPINYTVGLILALVLNTEYIKGRTFFRVAMIIPWAASTMFIIISLIWQFFFRDVGVVNQVLAVFGINGPAWLQQPLLAFGVILLVNLWFSFPFCFTIILGGLQAIPADQYEAAEMDGATYLQQLVNITLPLLRPTVVPAIVLSAIGAGGFQMFGTVWAITAGGPSQGAGVPGSTELVMIYAYKQVFQYNAYAKAGAFAVIVFIFLFIMTLYSLRITRITKGAYE
jgi:arabinogalactan oligomer / maltooligosaccharide transport system permease protein